MNKSGDYSTDLILLIIAGFCFLVVVFVGYRCCRRRRSAGKTKALQRRLKKKNCGEKKGEDTILLKEITHNGDEDLNCQAKDKKINPPSGSNQKKTKKNSKSCISPDPSEGSSNAHKKTKNCENKRSTSPTILGQIKLRSGDVESGINISPLNSTIQALPSVNTSNSMNKIKKEQNKGDRNSQTSNSTEPPSQIRKDKAKTQKSECSIKLSQRLRADGDPLGCTDPVSTPSKSKESAILEGLRKDKPKECCTKRRHAAGYGCTGSECKKCKPYQDDTNVSQPGSCPSSINDPPKATKVAWVEKNEDTEMSVSDEVKSSKPNSSPRITASVKGDHVNFENPSERAGDSMEVSPNTTETDHEMSVDDSAHKIERTDQEFLDISSVDASPRKDAELLNTSLREEGELLHPSLCKEGELLHPSLREKGELLQVEPPGKELFNYTEPPGATKRIESIGDVYDVTEYAIREWKGDTTKAHAIRKGYFEVPKTLGLKSLRVIRGDNYCAIRATLFQALVKRIPILQKFENIQQIPRQLLSDGCNWIEDWNFGARLCVGRNEVCKGMEHCLTELVDLVNLNSRMEGEGRVSHLLSFFNYKPIDYELRLLEAVKLLMMAAAVELHKLVTSEQDVPVFAIIMFARDSSPDPCQFMKKHLNAVGDSGGLEQVEMHLLGYTLGITIKVVRPSYFGQPDFIVRYPEDMPRGTPAVTLVAEDDRHYNVLD